MRSYNTSFASCNLANDDDTHDAQRSIKRVVKNIIASSTYTTLVCSHVDSWITAIASRSGPLLTAATHFAVAQGLAADDPPRGVGGLHTLSTLISRARHEADHFDDFGDAEAKETEDREFVAGAGAYLGILLLDHLPHGAHVANAGEHRLRLGAHGFFNPFAAVETALAARDTPRALIEAVKCAEAEAAGSGPIARVVKALREVLARQPHVHILEHFDQRVWLDAEGTRTELDLSRIIAATATLTHPLLVHAVERLCASVLQEAAPVLAWEAARELVVPRLVGRKFVDSVPNADDLHLIPVGPEVWETLVLRFDERARYVRRAEFEAWSQSAAIPTLPRTQALRNLARLSVGACFLEHDTDHGPLVVAQSRDGLDAARLLLPGLYDVLSRTLGPVFLVATPHRDTLLAGPTGPAELVAELQSRAEAAVRSVPNAISSQLWLVTGPGEWQPLQDAASLEDW
ncbi:MAG: hypothetical protein RL701_2615 [Pseudomonadota bacterium]|jgi:hypothetical protein